MKVFTAPKLGSGSLCYWQKRNLDNNPGGGGGSKFHHGYYELYFTKESNLIEGKIGPIKRKIFILLFVSTFYLPLFNSVTKIFS
jgi:hypothetical protein